MPNDLPTPSALTGRACLPAVEASGRGSLQFTLTIVRTQSCPARRLPSACEGVVALAHLSASGLRARRPLLLQSNSRPPHSFCAQPAVSSRQRPSSHECIAMAHPVCMG